MISAFFGYLPRVGYAVSVDVVFGVHESRSKYAPQSSPSTYSPPSVGFRRFASTDEHAVGFR